MNLPESIEKLLQPLFRACPLSGAMEQLVPVGPAADDVMKIAENVVMHRAIARHPALIAGIWLYVDELERSHRVSQGIEDATGAFWHGVMHRREGDFSNSHYWFNRAGAHPALAALNGYDPHAFIDEVQRQYRDNPAELVERQRQEWVALFSWCARHALERSSETES